MKSKELLKINERQSIVEIEKGDRIEYCVCSYYDDTRPEGSKWDWGHYFSSLEGAIKYAATECFKSMHRYVLIEVDEQMNISEETFHCYEDAYKEFKNRYNEYASYDDCFRAEKREDYKENLVGDLYFTEDCDGYKNDDIRLKLIKVTI